MAIIDLHIHSTYSDGDTNPKKLYRMIKEANIKVFSITDHDEIRGSKEMGEIVRETADDVFFISGVELTAKVPHGRMHILGYDIDLNSEKINSFVRMKKEQDRYNFLMSINELRNGYGISFSNSKIDAIINKPGNIGRVDTAHLLINGGYAKDMEDAFTRYLNPIQEKLRKAKKGVSKEECFTLIKSANGIVSWAHPNSYAKTYDELRSEVMYMKSIGLDALEVYHINVPEYYRQWLISLAHEFDLYITGGTDYHGVTVKPDVMLATGRNNNVNIDNLPLVDKIKQKYLSK